MDATYGVLVKQEGDITLGAYKCFQKKLADN